MRPALVMEIAEQMIVCMTADGLFVSLPLPADAKGERLAIGQEVLLNEQLNAFARIDSMIAAEVDAVDVEVDVDVASALQPKQRRYRFAYFSGLIAACLLALIVVVQMMSGSVERAVYAFITLDVNPSIELTIDEQRLVIGMRAINQDAKAIVKAVDFLNQPVEEVLDAVLQTLIKRGFLQGEQPKVVLSTVLNKPNAITESKTLNNTLEQALRKDIAALKAVKQDKVRVTALVAPIEAHEQAEKHKVSTGKYIMYLRAKQSGKPIEIEEIKAKSLTDIADSAEEEEWQEDASSEEEQEQYKKAIESENKREKREKANAPNREDDDKQSDEQSEQDVAEDVEQPPENVPLIWPIQTDDVDDRDDDEDRDDDRDDRDEDRDEDRDNDDEKKQKKKSKKDGAIDD